MTDVQTLTSGARDSESIVDFARWAAAALPQDRDPGGDPPAGDAVGEPAPAAGRQAPAAGDQAPLRWLESLRQDARPMVFEATPLDDVQHVRDLSPWILGAYQVRQGHVELAGCTLEPRPFLRLSFLADPPDRLDHVWFGGDGRPLMGQACRRLGLAQLRPATARLRRSDQAMIQQWIAACLAGCHRTAGGADRAAPAAAGDLLAATVAWCRWASGKVAISFAGGQRVEIPFDGWACDYRSGRLLPPPYRCAESGLASHHVCVLQDGTVTVIEALGRCEQSGAEVIAARLGVCEVTGRRALRDLMISCEVSGRQTLPDAAVRCQWCDRQVVPSELHEGRCTDCRCGNAIDPSDPLLQQVFAHEPQLARFRRWRGWRNDQVAVLVGSRWWGQRVFICDAGSGRIRRQGNRRRWQRQWQMQPPD